MNEFLDKLSDFLAERPGFLPLLGILLILLNLDSTTVISNLK